ncbi:MAG: radical SAM protein [Allobaculum sp.]
MGIKQSVTKTTINTALGYINNDPQKNLPRLMSFINTVMKGDTSFPGPRAAFTKVVNDPDNNMNLLLQNIFDDIDLDIIKTAFTNFIVNANIIGWEKQQDVRKEYGCNVPWTILLDPTSACNLHCTGCWAAEYGNRLNLSLDEIDDIIRQGKDMGIYFYIYTGGEPMVRKKDLIEICRRHNDCVFMCFTNGTLIDEDFAEQMLEVKNFFPVISVEGLEEATDFRRGDGVYQRVLHAMDILHEHKLPIGISCCYTSKNIPSIVSDEFIDEMISRGVKYAWYFHYMPVGNDAAVELLPDPEQREYMYNRIREIRSTKQIWPMDFQNDAEYLQGCIAGGRRYLHINANGDMDPCVFIHYSDSNIREKTILEGLCSPMFMQYKQHQPFNENHLRPCPMLENPEAIVEMVHHTNAHSTDLESPESVEHLADKTRDYAANWKPKADELWAKSHHTPFKETEEFRISRRDYEKNVAPRL